MVLYITHSIFANLLFQVNTQILMRLINNLNFKNKILYLLFIKSQIIFKMIEYL